MSIAPFGTNLMKSLLNTTVFITKWISVVCKMVAGLSNNPQCVKNDWLKFVWVWWRMGVSIQLGRHWWMSWCGWGTKIRSQKRRLPILTVPVLGSSWQYVIYECDSKNLIATLARSIFSLRRNERTDLSNPHLCTGVVPHGMPPLIQMMTCRLFNTKPLCESLTICCHLELWVLS